VFSSCLAAFPLQKPKTEQTPVECASGDGQCHQGQGEREWPGLDLSPGRPQDLLPIFPIADTEGCFVWM